MILSPHLRWPLTYQKLCDDYNYAPGIDIRSTEGQLSFNGLRSELNLDAVDSAVYFPDKFDEMEPILESLE